METPQDAAPQLWEQLPDHAVHLATEPELVAAWEHEVSERQAQAAKVESLLAYKARKLEQNQDQHTFTRRAVEKAITRDAATILGLTESAVRRLLGTAEFLTEKLPKTWEIYRSGRIDRESAAKAAQAVEDIAHREDLLPVIDAEIAERIPRENAGTVQKWVGQRVAELDTACFQQRYNRAQAKRYVSFRHLGNGMSRIEALIPTLVAAQVEQQIHSEARNAPRSASAAVTGSSSAGTQGSAAQERTLSQRIADAFIHRLQTGQHGADQHRARSAARTGTPAQRTVSSGPHPAGAANLKIGILVPVQTLTGESDAPAISWDRTWSLPADTARQIALDPDAEHDWYIAGAGQASTADTASEILTVVHPRKGPGERPLQDWISGADPVEDNLLSRTYQSRTSRKRQRDAVLIRDGQCTQSGCTNPGWQAEIDHTQSFETGGHTSADNLRVLCRDCHSIKSHRLDRTTGNSGRDSPRKAKAPARASPAEGGLPDWLVETRPPPDWAVHDAA